MKFILTAFSFLFCLLICQAQGIRGIIKDKDKSPVYGASIYIKETQQGALCNENGEYQIKLPKGTYTLEYRCIGYQTQTHTINTSNTYMLLDITLDNSPIKLNEVVIHNAEDPAYEIIRKAIAKAPIYQNAVESYTAESYIKGKMELEEVSTLMNKLSSDKGMKMYDFKKQVFLQESFNKIDYENPDKYTQTVLAFSSSIPENYDSKESFGIMSSSIYAPKFSSCISPLNSKAFSYYKYKYIGFSEENGVIINEIQFEGKVKDPELMKGTIYIADNTWHVADAKMEMSMMIGTQSFEITYSKIKENIYLPTTYKNNLKMSFLGIKGYFNYYSSVKYIDIKPKQNIIETKISENEKRSFLIEDKSYYKKESDSLATKRDSDFWKLIRTIPLDNKEEISYQRKDSVKHFIDSLKEKHREDKFSSNNLIFGGKFTKDSATVNIYYKGLIYALHDYNFVDGFTLGQTFEINNYTKKGKNNLKLSPFVYYATARKQLIYGSNLNFNYAPIKRGLLYVSGGSRSDDFNPTGVTPTDNTISTLFGRNNKRFLYKNDYISFDNRIDLANGLTLNTGLSVNKRSGLSNNTDWAIWGNHNNIKENIFSGERFDKTSYSIGLSYAPYAYYKIVDNKKAYQKITSPIFNVKYEEGLGKWQTNNSRFRKILGSIEQEINTDYFSKFDYLVEGGSFIGNTKQTHFADYQQFNTSDVLINQKMPSNSFMLLNSYKYSTNKYWISSHINYSSKYIFLKRLPFLQGIPVRENLHVKALYTPKSKLYNEFGYSLTIIDAIGIGSFVSLEKGKFKDFGLRITYNMNQIAQFK